MSNQTSLSRKYFSRKYIIAAQKGFWDTLPLTLAVIPWGILCGSLAIQKDFTVLEAMVLPLLVFAGAAQLIATELIASNAPLATVLFTTFIISSRHFLYGLALRNKLKVVSTPWRLSLGFLLTDELFALSGQRRFLEGKVRLVYGLVAGGFFYLSWQVFNIVGIVAGSYLPDLTDVGLDFAIAATFIALVIPSIINLPIFVAVCVSGLFSIGFKLLHWELGLVLSSLLGMGAGYIVQRMRTK